MVMNIDVILDDRNFVTDISSDWFLRCCIFSGYLYIVNDRCLLCLIKNTGYVGYSVFLLAL